MSITRTSWELLFAAILVYDRPNRLKRHAIICVGLISNRAIEFDQGERIYNYYITQDRVSTGEKSWLTVYDGANRWNSAATRDTLAD